MNRSGTSTAGSLVHGLLLRALLQLFMVTLLTGYCFVAAASPKLYGFKIVEQDNLMLHFDLDSAEARAELFVLENPHRLVIDLPGATLGTDLPTKSFDNGIVRGIRYAQHGDDQQDGTYLRIVLDLRQAVSATSQIVSRQGGQRLIVNMGVPSNTSLRERTTAQTPPPPASLRNVIVAIDAGHGGEDPGAVGRSNTYEKNVVLAVAIRLHNYLAPIEGITPVLIRETDIYIDLRERMEIARSANADIFVSIHADAFEGESSAHGSSVYALSMDGASSEAAAWLAKKENASAALYGDVLLSDMENGLAQTLLNLTQGNTMERSIEVGEDVLKELQLMGHVHKSQVEQAAFAVLKSPDIPSILVETAFISNRKDEKKLNSADYQERLAEAIGRGLHVYLQRRAPDGTLLAAQRRETVPVNLPTGR